MISFESTKQGYANLWDKAKLTSPNNAKKQAERIIAAKGVLQQVEDATDVPWWLVGCWLYRESDLDLNTYLGNGQSLNRVTTVVPAGRGPFPNFQAGAVDAIRYEHNSKGGWFYKIGKAAWTLEYCLWATEVWNGQGYFSYNINSPYVWSWTSAYTSGKVLKDHAPPDMSFVDPQGGVAAIMMALFELGVPMPSRIAQPIPEKPTMPTTPTVVTKDQFANTIDLIEKGIGFLPTVSMFVPQLKVIAPYAPLITGGLEMLKELESAPHDPQVIIGILLKHLQNIQNDLGAMKQTIAQVAAAPPVGQASGQTTTGG